MSTEIYKSHNHSHFSIAGGILYEYYKTIRGIRYRSVGIVESQITELKVSDERVSEFLNNPRHQKFKQILQLLGEKNERSNLWSYVEVASSGRTDLISELAESELDEIIAKLKARL